MMKYSYDDSRMMKCSYDDSRMIKGSYDNSRMNVYDNTCSTKIFGVKSIPVYL